ncbi:MAG: DUF4252 domain-containing protein [Bacteroidaceae bacterium]|nr:DUF4252 domain-containing protein [Bacteroidaceae bacterium]
MKQMVFKTIFVLAMAMMSLQANAQVKEFEKYADTKNVTYVFISKFMLRMAGAGSAPSVPGVDTKSIMNKLNGIQIISSENKNAIARLKTDAQNIVKQSKYELLMQVDEDGDKVRIYHSEGKQQSVVVMMADEGDEYTVIVFSGTFTMEDVMKMTQ